MGKAGKKNLLVNEGAPSPSMEMGSAAASQGWICGRCEPRAERRVILGAPKEQHMPPFVGSSGLCLLQPPPRVARAR